MLAILLWSAYFVSLATPGLRDRTGAFKGADFLHFYTAGQLLRNGRSLDLYDPNAHAQLQKALLPQSAGTYFVPMYGPQFYLLFEPLARLRYGWAAVIWALVSSLLYFASCYAALRTCVFLRMESRLLFWLLLAYPAFFSLIAFGQSSAPALALFVLAYLSLRSGRSFLAGLAFGSLVYKPQLGLAAAIILLAAGQWKVISGAIMAAVAQLGFALSYFGSDVMKRYGQSFLRLRNAEPFIEPKLYQMHSLRSFWRLLLPWPRTAFGLYVVCSIAFLIVGATSWRKGKDLRLRYAALLLCTILVAPHLWIYDLVILAPAFLLLGDWALEQSGSPVARCVLVLLYACYGLPLLGPLAQFTRVQLSVVAFALITLVLCRVNLPECPARET